MGIPGGGGVLGLMLAGYVTLKPLFRGHPRDQATCPLNEGWPGVFHQQTNIFFFYSASESLAVYFKHLVNV